MPALSCIELNHDEQDQLKTLLWQSLRSAISAQRFIAPPAPHQAALLQSAASFVSIYIDGELRGCTGSCEAQSPLWRDVCEHAYSSTHDRRFPPPDENDLAQLSFCISILSPLAAIENHGEAALLDELVPGRDGLLLEQQRRRALFLPVVWQSLPRPEDFLYHLKQKGGWPTDYWSRSIELFRFYTVEYTNECS